MIVMLVDRHGKAAVKRGSGKKFLVHTDHECTPRPLFVFTETQIFARPGAETCACWRPEGYVPPVGAGC